MNEAKIHMTDGNTYVVYYVSYDQNYTTLTFVSDDGTVYVFSKFNVSYVVLKEKK